MAILVRARFMQIARQAEFVFDIYHLCSVAFSPNFVHFLLSNLSVLLLPSHCTGSPSAADTSKIPNKSQSTNGKFSIDMSLFPTYLCILTGRANDKSLS